MRAYEMILTFNIVSSGVAEAGNDVFSVVRSLLFELVNKPANENKESENFNLIRRF